MLAKRILTAAALLAVFLLALFAGRWAFASLVALILALGAREWGTLSGMTRPGAYAFATLCAGLFGAAGWVLDSGGHDRYLSAALSAASVFWVVIAPVWLARGMPGVLLLRIAGLLVLLATGLAAIRLPPARLLLVMGLVWVADTAAYFGGTRFGRTKLAPGISPGKTWEGVACAAVASAAYAMIWAVTDPQLAGMADGVDGATFVGGALLLCAVSIVGDLFESALKRRASAKDSGTLLPGHGGVLDRIDSATAALPVAALLFQIARGA